MNLADLAQPSTDVEGTLVTYEAPVVRHLGNVRDLLAMAKSRNCDSFSNVQGEHIPPNAECVDE